MSDNKKLKTGIQKEIGDLAKVIGLLSNKYREEPLLNDARDSLLRLSVHVCRALDIRLQ